MDAAGGSATNPVADSAAAKTAVAAITVATVTELSVTNAITSDDHNSSSNGESGSSINHIQMGQMMRGSYYLTVCDVVESKKGHISLSAAHNASFMQVRVPLELPEPLEPTVKGRDRESPTEMSSSSESDEDEVVALCRDFYRRRLSSKWIVRQEDEDLTESESSDHPSNTLANVGASVAATMTENAKRDSTLSNNSVNNVKSSQIPNKTAATNMTGDFRNTSALITEMTAAENVTTTHVETAAQGVVVSETAGESDHDSGIEVLNHASSNSSVEDTGRATSCNNTNDMIEDNVNANSISKGASKPQPQHNQMDIYLSSTSAISGAPVQDYNGNGGVDTRVGQVDRNSENTGCATAKVIQLLSMENQNEDNSVIVCPFEQLQVRRSSLLDEIEETTIKFASKLNLLKAQIGSLMEKDNQLFRQLLDLHDSITDLRKSQIISPPTPSDIVIPAHYSYFGSISRSSSFSSSESSDTTVSPASSPAGSPLTLTPSATPSSTPLSTPLSTPVSPSAMSTTSSSRSSYSVKQRSTCCRRCSAYSQRQNKCRQLSGSSFSRKKRSFSISNISSGSDSGFELKLHSESDHEIFV